MQSISSVVSVSEKNSACKCLLQEDFRAVGDQNTFSVKSYVYIHDIVTGWWGAGCIAKKRKKKQQ